MEHRLSALHQLHFHSRFDPWFNGLGRDNCKTRRGSFKCWDLVRLILEILRYMGVNRAYMITNNWLYKHNKANHNKSICISCRIYCKSCQPALHFAFFMVTYYNMGRHISALGTPHFHPQYYIFRPLVRHIFALGTTHFGPQYDTFRPTIRHILAFYTTHFGPQYDTFSALNTTHFGPQYDTFRPPIRPISALNMTHVGAKYDTFRPYSC